MGDLRVDFGTSDPLETAMIKGNPDLDRQRYVEEFERSQP